MYVARIVCILAVCSGVSRFLVSGIFLARTRWFSEPELGLNNNGGNAGKDESGRLRLIDSIFSVETIALKATLTVLDLRAYGPEGSQARALSTVTSSFAVYVCPPPPIVLHVSQYKLLLKT